MTNRQNRATKVVANLSELCRALDVPQREVRYVLERGYVPSGVQRAPSSGNHRWFDYRQAFWLATVMRLRAAGLRTELAAELADHAEAALAKNIDCEPTEGEAIDVPCDKCDREWAIEIADQERFRYFLPSEGELNVSPPQWHALGKRATPVDGLSPRVTIRLDLSHIARQLRSLFNHQSERRGREGS